MVIRLTNLPLALHGGATLVALADGEATRRFADAVRQPVALARDPGGARRR